MQLLRSCVIKYNAGTYQYRLCLAEPDSLSDAERWMAYGYAMVMDLGLSD